VIQSDFVLLWQSIRGWLGTELKASGTELAAARAELQRANAALLESNRLVESCSSTGKTQGEQVIKLLTVIAEQGEQVIKLLTAIEANTGNGKKK